MCAYMQKVVCWGTLLIHWSCWNVKPMTFILVERCWILSKASWLKNTHTLHTQKRTQNNMQQCKKRLALPNAWNDSNVNLQPAQRHSINKIITHANQNGNRNSYMEHSCKCDVQDYYWKREKSPQECTPLCQRNPWVEMFPLNLTSLICQASTAPHHQQ